MRSRETGSLIGSEEFRYDPWGNLIEKRSKHSKLQHFAYDCENRKRSMNPTFKALT
ncbi:hypothetical protein [Pseudomonas putida]|uniref:hypothetical protein n=1 Tax=Pseudomonas putida TaxID=303 RepID=UPI003AF0EB1F